MSKTMIVLMLCAGAVTSPAMGADPAALAEAKQCFTCHAAKSELIGPSFSDIARRFKGVKNAESMLAGVIQVGSDRPGVMYHWGTTKMPAATARVPVSKDEAEVLAKYVLSFK
jgi:cytochrome c